MLERESSRQKRWEWEGIRPASTFTAECYARRWASGLRVQKETSIIQCSFSQPASYSNSVSGQILANMFPGNTVPMYLCQEKTLLCFKQRWVCVCVCVCVCERERERVHKVFLVKELQFILFLKT